MSGILTTNPPPLTEKVEGFPHELSDFVARLLGKSPHLRYRTCERALATIEHIATNRSLGLTILAQHGWGKSDKIERGINDGSINGVIMSPRDETPANLARFLANIADNNPC